MSKLEIVSAIIPESLGLLVKLDATIFNLADCYSEKVYKLFDNYLLKVDGVPSGFTALLPNHTDDSTVRGVFPEKAGTLYVATTGILAHLQGKNLGRLFKSFHIAYAAIGGFLCIRTCARAHNAPIIALNKKFGLFEIDRVPAYYKNPTEDRIVFELCL